MTLSSIRYARIFLNVHGQPTWSLRLNACGAASVLTDFGTLRTRDNTPASIKRITNRLSQAGFGGIHQKTGARLNRELRALVPCTALYDSALLGFFWRFSRMVYRLLSRIPTLECFCSRTQVSFNPTLQLHFSLKRGE